MDITEFLSSINFFQIQNDILNSDLFEIVFPFLLLYAFFYSALLSPKIKFLVDKKTKKPNKAVVILISFIISLFGVMFEIREGYGIVYFMKLLFPNISFITVGVLGLYIAGSILGEDYFRGLFRKDISAYIQFAVGAFGLGTILYYILIFFGIIEADPLNTKSLIMFVLFIGLVITGFVMFFINQFAMGSISLIIGAVMGMNLEEGIIGEILRDPALYILVVFILIMSWLNSPSTSQERVAM